jgi:hypothetical protein
MPLNFEHRKSTNGRNLVSEVTRVSQSGGQKMTFADAQHVYDKLLQRYNKDRIVIRVFSTSSNIPWTIKAIGGEMFDMENYLQNSVRDASRFNTDYDFIEVTLLKPRE